jgi:hypothetical protein
LTHQNGSNGQHLRIDADRQAWLERLLSACERVADSAPDPNDPYLRMLLEDVEALRSRLTAELESLSGPTD